MKRVPSDSVLEPYFKAFIGERVERLVSEGKKLLEFLQGKEELAPMRKQAAEAMDADEVDYLMGSE